MEDARGYFDRLYRGDPDPWDYETSAYERDKYRATLGALTHPTYASSLEVGCSIGVLSALIAERSRRFLGLDVSPIAIERARARCASITQARFATAQLPRDWPQADYDLIVLSEVLYFLMPPDIRRMAELVARDLQRGGDCVVVNWRGSTGTPVSGEAAALCFGEALRDTPMRLHLHQENPDYLLEVYRHEDAPGGTGGQAARRQPTPGQRQ